jgi:hypothetical protein
MEAVGAGIHGIASVRRVHACRREDGTLETLHEWTASATLPRMIQSQADARALTWIERTTWEPTTLAGRWTVESCLLGRSVTGSGVTRLESAMGNRGTRLHFEITTNVDAGSLGPLGNGHWTNGISDAAATVLAKTLQDLGRAIETYLAPTNGAVHALER